ncbi:hypothetical protein McaMca56_000494 [Microsporum canis]
MPKIFKILPQLWRLLTPFILTGGGLSFFLDLYFLYSYASDIEVNSPRFSGPGDFVTYVIFVAIVILLQRFLNSREIAPALRAYPSFANVNPLGMHAVEYPLYQYLSFLATFQCLGLTDVQLTAGLYLQSYVFLGALSLAFLTTLSQDNAGKKMPFIIFQLPAEYLPFASLIATLVLSGQHAALTQACGILAAHLYEFLTRIYPNFGGGTNYIRTPRFIQNLFRTNKLVQAHGGYRMYRPPANDTSGPSTGQSSGNWFSGMGGSWQGRGAGRKLGSG